MKKIIFVILCLFIGSLYVTAEVKNTDIKTETLEIRRIFIDIMQGKKVSKEDVQKIEKSFKNKIKEKPQDSRGYLALGQIYERTDQIDKAINWYRQSTQVDPGYANGFNALGVALGQKGLLNESIIELEKAKNLEPENWEIISNLASTHLLLKSYDKAIELYKQALDANPKEIKTKIRLAQCYMTAGKYEDAITAYEAILKERPDLTQFEQNLDQLYKKVGRERKSGTVYELKKEMEKQGYHASIQRAGNVLMVAPTYYKEGKTPISKLERKVFNEYKDKVEKALIDASSPEEKQKIKYTIATEIAKKYNMTNENFVYMILKIMYNEVTPDTYISPSEQKTMMKDVTKDKYEMMTPAERTEVVKNWDAKTDFEKLQKESLLYEARGDYKNAVIRYKKILAIVEKNNIDESTAMMHCALQRCYEKLEDSANERKQLAWINNNMMTSSGRYSKMVKFLTATVVAHLKERMAKFNIEPRN